MSETQAAEIKVPGAQELKDLAAKLQDLLKIRTLPIGMKQFETVEAMEKIPGLRRPKAGVALDYLVLPKVENAAQVEQRSEEHTSELQSLMRISYAVFCLKKKKKRQIK